MWAGAPPGGTGVGEEVGGKGESGASSLRGLTGGFGMKRRKKLNPTAKNLMQQTVPQNKKKTRTPFPRRKHNQKNLRGREKEGARVNCSEEQRRANGLGRSVCINENYGQNEIRRHVYK